MPNELNLREKDIKISVGMRSAYECLTRKEKYIHTGKQHYHPYIELIYCEQGEITILCCQNEIHMKPGDMIYIAPNIIHNITYTSDYSEHYCIKLDMRLLNPVNLYSIKNIKSIIVHNLRNYEYFCKEECNNSSYDIQNLFFESVCQYKNKNYCSDLISYANILKIISFIIQIRSKIKTINFESNFASKADYYINKNFQTVTLESISKHMGMSYTYFSKIFVENFGMNYSSYLNKIRTEKSIEMLTNTDNSITEIALMVGFSSTSHFIKVFKNLMKITPSKYRKL